MIQFQLHSSIKITSQTRLQCSVANIFNNSFAAPIFQYLNDLTYDVLQYNYDMRKTLSISIAHAVLTIMFIFWKNFSLDFV